MAPTRRRRTLRSHSAPAVGRSPTVQHKTEFAAWRRPALRSALRTCAVLGYARPCEASPLRTRRGASAEGNRGVARFSGIGLTF